MNFIYDILLNFNSELYDFYEWNSDDNVIHIRKIPLFRVSSCVLSQMKKFNIKVDLNFLKRIENKTEKFTSRDVEKVKYVALFSDTNDVLALNFNEEGINISMSKLLIDECEDVLEVVNRCSETTLDLEVLKSRGIENFKTRKQIEQINYLNKSLNRLEKNNDIEKLEYLYFECFNERQNSINDIIDKLKQSIVNGEKIKTMCEFFKLISINNV